MKTITKVSLGVIIGLVCGGGIAWADTGLSIDSMTTLTRVVSTPGGSSLNGVPQMVNTTIPEGFVYKLIDGTTVCYAYTNGGISCVK